MKTMTVSKRFVTLLCCVAVCIALIATALGVNLASRAQAEDAQEDGIELLEEEPTGDIQLIEEETEGIPEDLTGEDANQAGESAVTEEIQSPAEEPVSGEPDETTVPEDSTEPESPAVPEDSTESESPAEPEGFPEESGEPDVAEPAGSEEPAEPDLTGTEATGETVDAAEAEPEDIDADVVENESDDTDADAEETDAEDADAEEEANSDEGDYGIMLLEMIEGSCGDDVTWVLDEDSGELIIYGSGAMNDWNSGSQQSWYRYESSITSVVIENGVTSIGNYAFCNCTNLASVELPSTLTSIGNYAFYGCKALTSITMLEGVTSIGERAFYNCTSLVSVELPSTLTSIGDYTFDGCSALTGISIPEGIISIGDHAFYNCTSLTSVELPSTLTIIDTQAFYGCSALTSITIPEGVTSIGERAFYNCTSLTSVEFPSSLISIGDRAFQYCPLNGDSMVTTTNVKAGAKVYAINSEETTYTTQTTTYTGHTLTIPESVTSVGEYAFAYTSVDIFVIGSNLTNITATAFASSSLDAIIFDNSWDQVNIDSYTVIARLTDSDEVFLVFEKTYAEITVSKVWDDTNNQDGIRPSSIDIQLTADGVAYDEPVTLDDSNNWSYTWEGLDVYADDDVIVYEVIEPETPDGYTQSDAGMVKDADGNYSITIINSHETQKTDISVSKEWDDADNQDGLRPAIIDVQLMANDVEYGDTVTLDDSNDWSYTWEGLDVYADGQEIVYEVIEPTTPDDYRQSNTGMVKDDDGNYSITITNFYEPLTTEVSVSKLWDDEEDQDGIRPDFITVNLLADGTIIDTVILDENNYWYYRWEELPVNAAGSAISYSVEETDVPEGYFADYDREPPHYLMIVNTHIPETIDISGIKVWDDADDADGIRPDEIIINLFADGVEIDNTTVTAEDGWSFTFEGFNKYRDGGVEIEYSVSEDAIDGYTTEIAGDAESGFVITNSHVPVRDLTIQKDVAGTSDISAYDFEIALTQDGIGFEGELTLSNGETVTFSDGKANLSVAAGEAVTVLDIPYGLDCSVTELTTGADSVVVTDASGTVIAYASGTQATASLGAIQDNTEMTFTNSYREYFPVDEEIVTDEEDPDSWVKNESVNEYNAIEIEMSTYLPAVLGYDVANGAFTMSFHDQLDSELVLDEANADFSVAIAGYRIDPAYYSVSLGPDDGCTFHVDVDLSALYNDGVITDDDLEGATPISVVFFADLEGTGLNGTYASTAWYDFADEGVILYTSEADTVYVYTYEIEILKVDAEIGEALEGATLGVYYDSELTNPVSRNGEPFTAVSGDDGYAVFYGLAEGTYYIAEVVAPDGYLLSADVLEVVLNENTVDANNIYSTTFGNTLLPETIDISVTKVWNDADNQDGIRPDSITVQLLANGNVIDEQILSADNGWSYTWSELDVYENGEAISYSVIEPATPEGYTQSDTGLVDNGDGTYSVTIINTHTPEGEIPEPSSTIDVTVVKVWNDNNDLYGERPELIVVVLLENGKATTLTQLLSAENSWTGTFWELPEYDENGEKIVYSITEVTVPNYTSVITGDQDSGFTVTNTYDFDEITNPEPGTPNSGNPNSGNPEPGVPQTGQDSLPIAPLAVSGAVIVAAGVALLAVRRRRAA